jgi:hypothetical protein
MPKRNSAAEGFPADNRFLCSSFVRIRSSAIALGLITLGLIALGSAFGDETCGGLLGTGFQKRHEGTPRQPGGDGF